VKAKTRWIMAMVAVGLAGALFFTLFAGQQAPQTPQTQKAVTLEDIYALLVDQDGKSRLDASEQILEDLDTELDLIYQHELKLIEDEATRSEERTWTTSDLMFLLQRVDSKLDQILTHGHP